MADTEQTTNPLLTLAYSTFTQQALIGSDVNTLAQLALHGLLTGLNLPYGLVFWHNPADGTWSIRAAMGWAPAQLDEVLAVARPGILSAHMLGAKLPLIIDWNNAPPIAPDEYYHHVSTTIAINIPGANRPLGLIFLDDTRSRSFSPAEQLFCQSMAAMLGQAALHHQTDVQAMEQRRLNAVLQNNAAALSRTLSLHDVLNLVLTNLEQVIPYHAANIMLIEPDDQLRIVRRHGFSAATGYLLAEPSQLFQEVLNSDKPIIIDDITQLKNHAPLSLMPDTRAYLGAPIRHQNKVIGLLNLASTHPDFYDEQHSQYLEVFADQVAIAITNARLFESEKHQRQIAETLFDISTVINSSLDLGQVLLNLANPLLSLSGFHICTIARWDQNEANMVNLAEVARCLWKPGRGQRYSLIAYPILSQVLETGESVIVRRNLVRDEKPTILLSEQGKAGSLISPLRAGDQIIGLVELASPQVDFATDTPAIAQSKPLLSKAAATLSWPLSDEDREYLLHLAQQLVKQTAASVCQIVEWLYDTDELSVVTRYSNTLWTYYTGPVYPLQDFPISQRELNQNRPTLTVKRTDFSLDQTSRRILDSRSAYQMALQPLFARERPIGMVQLFSIDPDTDIDQDILDLWRILFDHAAIAIYNAQLFEAERQQRVLAEKLQKTAEVLAGSVSRDETIQIIIDQLSTMIDFEWALVMLVEDDGMRVVVTHNYADLLDQMLAYEENSLIHQSMVGGYPAVLYDVMTELDWAKVPGIKPGTQSWFGIPLVAWGMLIGYLSVGSDQHTIYGPREMQIIKAFSHQVTVALENTRILDELDISLSTIQQTRTQLVRTARLTAAGEIATGIAHQINNPLTAILAEVHLMSKRVDEDHQFYESIGIIKEAADRAGTIVQRMLDFARSTPFAVYSIDLNQSLKGVVKLVRGQIEPDNTLILDLAQNLPPVKGSEPHLDDVWINMLLNARDAIRSHPDGEIRLTTRYVPLENAIEVIIADNGMGIPSKDIERIFDPFYTTKSSGTGLGLSVGHDVITRHGGSIRVESEEGQGTTFVVTLPVEDEHPE